MRITKQDLFIIIFPGIRWYKDNKCHREDGPATIWNASDEYYYLNGKSYFKDKEFYWKEVRANY